MKGIATALFLLLPVIGVTADYHTPKPGDPLRKTLLDALRVDVEEELGQEVLFKIDDLRVSSEWGFLSGRPLTKSQGPIDYSRTKYAQAVRDGAFDDWICALFVKENGHWFVAAYVIGATDVPYVAWPENYGVPREIVFGEQ